VVSDCKEEKVMKEKDIINSEKLESINSELFGAFEPADESCIGGRGLTHTEESTYHDGMIDILLDLDILQMPY
jgi:hypothetical protein